jgi:hypothetical protein
MQRRTYLAALGSGVAAFPFVGQVSADERPYRPGGPWPGQPDAINIEGYHDNEQLAAALTQIADQSDRVDLRQIGQSAGLGAPIWEVAVGDGDTNVHLITQIHGDEATGTEVILKVLRELAHGTSRQVDAILDELTLTIVPRVNPDGAVFEYDVDDDGRDEMVGRRTNTQEWSPGDSEYEPYYHYASPPGTRPGYDMNRDFNVRPPDEFDPREDDQESWWDETSYMHMPYQGYTLAASGLRLTPEVRAVTESYLDADPDIAITHHHQGANLKPGTGDGNKPPRQVILSVMGAYGPAYRDRSPFFPPSADVPLEAAVNPFLDEETSTRSIRLNALVANALAERGNSVFDAVTRYGYFPLWGSYLDALCPNTDAAGMLYEVSYQTDMRGQQALGRMMQASKVGFLASFEALAAGTLAEVDVEDYFSVPLSGPSIGNPHEQKPPR